MKNDSKFENIAEKSKKHIKEAKHNTLTERREKEEEEEREIEKRQVS